MRVAWRVARWLALSSALLSACSGETGPVDVPPIPSEVTFGVRFAGAQDWPAERLREQLGVLDAERAAAEDALLQARLSHHAGRLARLLAARTGEASDVAAARERLTATAALPSPNPTSWTVDAELCEAGLEHVRLESIEARDVDAAQRVATQLTERFEVADTRPDAVGDDAPGQLRLLECLRQARRVSASLEGSRAALADDTDAGVGGVAEGAEDAGVTVAGPVTMTNLAVYSGGALGARAVLHFDGEPTYEVGQSPEAGGQPARAWIDVRQASVAPSLGEVWRVNSGGLVQVLRTTSEDGGARVVFELAPGLGQEHALEGLRHRSILHAAAKQPSHQGGQHDQRLLERELGSRLAMSAWDGIVGVAAHGDLRAESMTGILSHSTSGVNHCVQGHGDRC